MRLRNKKTGEINYGDLHLDEFDSLAELNEEWEDYEEPKRHWIIDTMNDRVEDFDVPMDFNESIGNYFESREEAKKAVGKLKAWKRLKDKGFRFNGGDDACISYILDPVKWDDKLEKDFDLLFSGEDD